MVCLKGPSLPPIVLPTGITLPVITLPLPSDLTLCCRLVLPFPRSIGLPPIPIPSAVLDPILEVIEQVNDALDLLQLSCPFD